jgi:hypothetical protein
VTSPSVLRATLQCKKLPANWRASRSGRQFSAPTNTEFLDLLNHHASRLGNSSPVAYINSSTLQHDVGCRPVERRHAAASTVAGESNLAFPIPSFPLVVVWNRATLCRFPSLELPSPMSCTMPLPRFPGKTPFAIWVCSAADRCHLPSSSIVPTAITTGRAVQCLQLSRIRQAPDERCFPRKQGGSGSTTDPGTGTARPEGAAGVEGILSRWSDAMEALEC